MKEDEQMKYYPVAIAFLVGLAGAWVFNLAGAPMPFLLGPLFAVLAVQLFTPIPLKWHSGFRNAGLVAAGYVIGIAFTLQAIQGMKQYFAAMLVINVAFFFLFLLISSVMERRTKVDKGTAMTCCVPGGLSQIIAFAEEQKGIDLTAVTFYHLLRVLMIVAIVPFIVAGGNAANAQHVEEAHISFPLIGLLAVSYIAGMASHKLKIPTAFLLGPIFFIMVLNLAGIEVPQMPASLLHLAQGMIGIYIGLLLKKENLKLSNKLILYAFISSAMLIAAAYGVSLILQDLYGLSFSTSFLSVVPGGLDQMGIIAASVHADVTVVTAFQLFRILFLSAFVVPFVKYMGNRRVKAKAAEM